jgi:uncharacterized membrane protein
VDVTDLTVWRFEGPRAAQEALPFLERLAANGHISVDDAALVSWPRTSRKPSTRELGGLTGPGALWGGSWGLLLGLIFLVPIAGPTFGAAAGAIAGGLGDFGIDDDFIKRVRDAVTPDTSALFVLGDSADTEALAAEMPHAAVVRCELSVEHERRLRAALGEESRHPIG